jgi:hypothetical protein
LCAGNEADDGIVRRTLNSIRRRKPRINRSKIDATTEADIRRHIARG